MPMAIRAFKSQRRRILNAQIFCCRISDGRLCCPAFAADYYVALRVGGGGCEVMTTAPTDTKKYKMMGKYSSEADAKAAMATMAECK